MKALRTQLPIACKSSEVSGTTQITVELSQQFVLWRVGRGRIERAWRHVCLLSNGANRFIFVKVDPNNAPHVGGNTWAGGTGGRDTAGLGGKGGPYRLDAGHDVHQLSDEEKDAVPDDVKRAAREMGRRAFKQR